MSYFVEVSLESTSEQLATVKLLNTVLYLVKKKSIAVLCNKSKKKKIIQIQTTIYFLTGGEEIAVIWPLYFIVAVGRKLLWIFLREIRHATLKLQTMLQKVSLVPEESSVLRVQSTVK